MDSIRLLWQHRNLLFFVGGFLFDCLTLTRIDSFFDLALQLTYLSLLTILLIFQYRDFRGVWQPRTRLKRFWPYNVEALHFIYGALLSAYVVLYFKSTSGVRPFFFLLFIFALMVMNEMPQIRRQGYRLRLGLYALCVSSFLNFFVPILIGRMGAWVFLIAMSLSGAVVWFVASRLAFYEEKPREAKIKLFLPGGVVLSLLVVLYFRGMIPPVPLSVPYHGVFHGVEQKNSTYELRYLKPPFYRFWRKESRPFLFVSGDTMVYFVRVFAPVRFRHKVVVKWEWLNPKTGEFVFADQVPIQVAGGRAEGYRGYVAKSNFEPGEWRVKTETEQGQLISSLRFKAIEQPAEGSRAWRFVRM